MTGIERLRKLADDMLDFNLFSSLWDGTEDAHGVDETSATTVRDRLREIADQIEREGEPRSTDTTISAYDLLSEESQRALEWVREHGGVDAIERRLLPEGYEWPRFKDGEPVGFGETGLDVHGHERRAEGVSFTQGGFVFIRDDMGHIWWGNDCGPSEDPEVSPCRRVKRPRPPVLAADGEPLEVGQTVYGTRDDEPVKVVDLCSKEFDGVRTVKCEDGLAIVYYAPDDLTHHHPVLDADGVPVRVGDTVWICRSNGDIGAPNPRTVKEVNGSLCVHLLGISACYKATDLTHTEPDSWERIEDDIAEASRPDDYCRLHRIDASDTSYENAMARDIVLRCKRLAGVSE